MNTFAKPPRLATCLVGSLLVWQGAVAQPDTAPAVIVAEARVTAVADRIDALGTARAAESVTITSVIAEKIVELGFDDGQTVSRGDVLAVLDSRIDQANLARARATRAERRLALSRSEKLANRNLASAEDLDLARLAVQQIDAEIMAIEARIDKHVIRAPFNGVVGMRSVSLGALVSPGDAVTTLDDTRTIKLDFPVPAAQLTGLAVGQTVTATDSAAGRLKYSGTISTIGARIDPATRAALVRARVDNADGAIRPGMLLRVSVAANPRQAVVVPEAALTSSGRDKHVLVVGEDGLAQLRAIEIGARLPGQVEITDGLEAGERVITDGLQKARPGKPVSIRAVDDGTRSLGELLSSAVTP